MTPSAKNSGANSTRLFEDLSNRTKRIRDVPASFRCVYSALRAVPEVWKKTFLIVTFDEHGRYYGHFPPPGTVSPDGIAGRMDQPSLVPFDFKRLGLRVPTILISPWFAPGVDSTVYSHASIVGSVIDVFKLPGGYLTERDRQAAKLTDRCLVRDASRRWRDNVPDLVVPVQPQSIDAMQRELLNGTVHMDPQPAARNELRTQDIQDPMQANSSCVRRSPSASSIRSLPPVVAAGASCRPPASRPRPVSARRASPNCAGRARRQGQAEIPNRVHDRRHVSLLRRRCRRMSIQKAIATWPAGLQMDDWSVCSCSATRRGIEAIGSMS